MIRNKRGFTLIELIMVIVLVGIIAGVIAPFMGNAFTYWALVRNEREAIATARMALARMTREIRHIEEVTSIDTFTATQFEFDRVKPDQTMDDVDFELSGDTILRNSQELADNVSSLAFAYLDADGNTTATQADIRMVQITLTVTVGEVSVTLQSLARFRNIDWYT